MEKQAAKPKNKIFSFLVSFQNPLFSPGRDTQPDVISHKLRTHPIIRNKGFSGPILSMVQADARREPTSPKVSCMGQIKHKNRIISKKKHASLVSKPDEIGKIRPAGPAPGQKKKLSGIKKIFGAERKADNTVDYGDKPQPIPNRAPSLSQMRKFRESTLANFDWATAMIAPEDQEGNSDVEDDVIVPFSAPLMLVDGDRDGGGLRLEPRKEINLWKKRAIAQPQPLQLSMVR